MTPESPSDPPVQQLQIPLGSVGYTDEGQGPVVVAIPGNPGTVRDYRWLASAMPDDVRFIRVDLPGFGATPLSTSPHPSPESRAEVVRQVIQCLELDRPVVLGHSFGGTVAAALASQYPAEHRALILLASVAIRPHAGIRQLPMRLPLSCALSIPPFAALARKPLAAAFKRSGFHGWSHEQHVQALKVLGRFRFSRHKRHIAALRVPTMVAWTADDPLIEEAASQDLYWRCPSGPRIRFSDGGHNLQKTRAVELAESISVWVRGLP
ncbi:MAG: alpha/beta fold hydrolase [Rhodobacterales bacterium]|nr:alpha/beta fold hydrolase [Rhodobacterales bacterium]